MVSHPRRWAWSSYRATVGETRSPAWLSTDWVLGQFGPRVGVAQTQYRAFVADGHRSGRPWDQVTGQIYLGGEDFIARHQPGRMIREIPRHQTQAARPSLVVLFQRRRAQSQIIYDAYRQHGYRLAEIATHLGVHYATVSRRLHAAEQRNI